MSIPSVGENSMEKVEDYNELERLEKIEGREVLVLYSNLIYRVIQGKWEVVRKGRRQKP